MKGYIAHNLLAAVCVGVAHSQAWCRNARGPQTAMASSVYFVRNSGSNLHEGPQCVDGSRL